MPIKVIDAPDAVISVEEARLQCKVDPDDTSHDGLLGTLIAAAHEYAEHYTQTSIGEQSLELALDCFPACNEPIELRRGPVTSVTSVTYVDTAGVVQTLPVDQYVLDDFRNPARLVAAYGVSWPSTRRIANAVKVRYDAGTPEPKQAHKQGMLVHIELESPLNPHTPQEREALEKARDTLLGTDKVWGY